MRELGKLLDPSQFREDAAQSDEQVDVGCCRQRRGLRVQVRHPAKDVRFTVQLSQEAHLGVESAEITQEVAGRPPIVTSRVGMERSAEGIDGTVENSSQGMLERGASSAVHNEVPGRGRMCWATARAYCR